MILVDVFVPSIDKVYDFQLNENVTVMSLIEEICETIEQKEHVTIDGDSSKMQLCEKVMQICLEKNKTLSDYSIITGHSLILV